MRKYTYLIFLMILVLVFSACVPTPIDEAVVKKDQQQMLQQAASTPASHIIDVNLYEQLGAPNRYENNLSGSNGRLTVCVNAELILPENSMPIVRIAPIRFTMEQILFISSCLMPSGSRYVDFDAGRSKGYYTNLIQRYLWAIDHWNDGGNDLLSYNSVHEAEKELAKILTDQSIAPDVLPGFEPTSIPCEGDYPAEDKCRLVATKDDVAYSMIYVTNLLEDFGQVDLEYNRDLDSNYHVRYYDLFPSDLSMKTAEDDAYALLKKLRFEGFVCSAAFPTAYFDWKSEPVPCYHFIFTRSFGDAIETVTNIEETTETYDKPWGYEQIHLIMDENGLAGFRYIYPHRIVEIINSQANLLPFSEIQKTFEKRITVYHNNLADGTQGNVQEEYIITSIRLGLVSIKEENAETGLLVPAWDFLGYIRYLENGKEYLSETNELHSFLTINAIDGSIIERDGA